MSIRARQGLMLALVCAFVAQTWLVYADPAGKRTPLSPLAARGRALWHRRNCQSCHQIYGFGGFLGPDLTNAVLGGTSLGSATQLLRARTTWLLSPMRT